MSVSQAQHLASGVGIALARVVASTIAAGISPTVPYIEHPGNELPFPRRSIETDLALLGANSSPRRR